MDEKLNKENSTVLSVEQILTEGRALESKPVPVKGFSGPIMMSNVSFEEITIIKQIGDVNTRLVAAVCGMDPEQARELSNGHALKFTNLLVAVNKFLGFTADDVDIQK